ncbi:MAG: N-acetyltransferase family protein, partial [Chitinophagaceae bacterium]
MNIIRLATPADTAAILEIYSPFILNSGITQETELPTLKVFQQRIISTLEERPWLVCELEGEIAGYAYAGRHRERKGYQWSVEPSVYINEKFYRHAVAKALYTALFDILKLQGYVNAYAVITLPNEKSVAFHEKFGFSYLTTYKKIGYKLGQWHDVGWWELSINPHDTFQKEPVKLS